MNVFKEVIRFYRHVFAQAKLTNAINQADRQAAKDHDVWYVLPGYHGKLLVTNKLYFKQLKRKGYVSKKRNMNDVKWGCFYATGMSEDLQKQRREEYFKWIEKSN